MTTRSTRRTLTFEFPFQLDGIDRFLEPGDYEILTDEELLEGISFTAYRRTSTAILLNSEVHKISAIEMLEINPENLEQAHQKDIARRGKIRE